MQAPMTELIFDKELNHRKGKSYLLNLKPKVHVLESIDLNKNVLAE